jgi:hypothetical protein
LAGVGGKILLGILPLWRLKFQLKVFGLKLASRELIVKLSRR